jgi:hypothetical protein
MAMRAAMAGLMQPQSNTASLGTGPPPQMPGLPPPPEMLGGMPTGGASTTGKAAADAAILSLRDAKGHFPSLGDAIENMIAQLKSAASQSGPPPAPVGSPSGPGAATVDSSPTMESGSPGTI